MKRLFKSLSILLIFLSLSPAVFAKEKSYQDTRTFEREVIRLVNVERAKVGLKPLSENVKLSKVARIKSQDMINKKYFSHYSPTYGSPFDMMKKFGIRFRAAGENIAMGQKTPKEVMNAWMNSAGHRRNILNPNFTQIGVGVAKDSKGRLYWTQMFIRP
ncbi:Transporter [Caloramator australicus RC3]|uniref:Transporter n=1 Tax=Caloramator australicus RC3 TaxID=857293 RepID=I7J6I4_9CLOT|nr:Transporter [Caloramator australicus RC3]